MLGSGKIDLRDLERDMLHRETIRCNQGMPLPGCVASFVRLICWLLVAFFVLFVAHHISKAKQPGHLSSARLE